MMSKPIHTFAIKAKIIAPKTGAHKELKAIIDTGCTHYLINLPTILRLGIRMKKLT